MLNGNKSTLIASVSNTRRNALSPEGVDAPLTTDIVLGGLNDNTHQLSASLSLAYRLSSRTAATLTTSKSRSVSTTTNLRQNQANINLVVNHQFGRKLSGSAEVHRTHGDAFGLGNRTYSENAISDSLNYQL